MFGIQQETFAAPWPKGGRGGKGKGKGKGGMTSIAFVSGIQQETIATHWEPLSAQLPDVECELHEGLGEARLS